MTVGAGVGWQDVYEWAEAQNITAIGATSLCWHVVPSTHRRTGGYHQTVGASGGWLMGGGHSVLSPVYGLGVDRVVQFKVVTPDGVYRTANECQNSE
jgi:FAD/FMN-containing dehydrogenase